MASIGYTVGDNWDSGFIGNMTVASGSQALDGWTVEFDATFDISNIWNAEILSHVGNHYVIGNADWNADVPAGGQASFGFQATPGSTGTAATGFIVNGAGDPEEPPTLTIDDASIDEGNAGTRQLTFSVRLSEASTGPVTVHYATEDRTATAGSDYTARSGTLSFAAGETVKTITVPILGDQTIEANEAFVIKLSDATGATIADAAARAVIRNDDSLPGLSVADASLTEGNGGTRDLTFTVTLSQAATGPVTVAYATANGSATAGSDYAARSGTLTFAAGETSKVVRVQVTGDSAVEGNETLTLDLSAPSGAAIVDGTATGTITNDDGTAGLPSVSIGDVKFKEGSAGAPGVGVFKVTLSEASTSDVTVSFATQDGTAVAGSDYVGRTGTVTFAAGETQKNIRIRSVGDAVVEGNETFRVVLSDPAGAVIADNSGTGTIVNDDTGGPTLAISDVSVVEGDPGDGAAAPGWFSTSGNQIVDAGGNVVQIAGVNWFGFESSTLAPHGLWTRGYKEMMDQMASEGFNTIRLPFSNDTLHSSTAPNGIDFNKNPDLQGLSALQVMDKIVDYAGQIGLRIILDHHRNDSGAGTSGNGLWYDGQHSETDWIADWRMLAERYADDPTVIGADLHNEPYNGTWGGGGANDWAAAAERAGNAIGAVNTDWLIFVEGVAVYQGQNYWWGGNLMGVRDRPIELDVADKLVYSAHDYPHSIYPQPWFEGTDFAAGLPAKFDEAWGYIYREGIAPVYIGEFGTRLVDPKDAPWFEAITSYLSGDFDNDGDSDLAGDDRSPSWTFWSWNPNSTDTGGILGDDWRTVFQNKLDYLEPIQFDFDGDVAGGGHHADFVLTLSEAATTAITVSFHTVPGDATSADFTSRSGTVTFAPGEQSKTISIPITADDIAEGNERFTVVLTNAVGATLARATGTATIVDDDAAPAARTFSPYIDMAMPVAADLVAISEASGVESFTLAFMLSSSEGIGWQGWGGIEDDLLSNGTTIQQQVQAIQDRGGEITISFGGAAGQEAAATAPSAAALQAMYQSVIDRYDVASIDFDIEGAAVLHDSVLELRDQAIVGLQAANPDLEVSFTLPVLPTGLDFGGLNVLQHAKDDGVRIDLVNIMAMNYGPANDNGGQMGQNAILAAEATQQQLDDLGIDARIGITPMIGVNDVASEVFTLADAEALLDYAESDPDVALLSMWSVARDNGGSAGATWASPDSSGIAQGPYDFAAILGRFD